MGRTVIDYTECAFCHKKFDVATEDLDWGSETDMGEREDNPSLHDYTLFQKLACPKCGKENDMLVALTADAMGMNQAVVSIENIS
jgi:hypothetical protein